TLLQGICGVAGFCVERRTRGGELAREDLRHHLWERGLSRERRRSRRKTYACGLPGESRHPMLLPLRARSRGKPRSYKGFVALPEPVSSAEPVGASLLAKADSQSLLTG
ncbi:hypothetical protein, partial [Pseudomonas sp. efr-133-TYG-103a]|uniref:hypothetical protein n=1 Tax=Pseudomonas sp. efr-133-TYG-103a TaxID=3040308 RepID=UPI0025547562